ncbi:unnamed protein product [Zymoseptoria tritici ST99CH_3D7]|uniref:Fibronectin type-III domain-containing protein n=1 Tax=Zymoseptoria tritici (strain ST99CH_3D7) TaxID=1276538 RepID=A0A1X7RQV2_ZYMT9|nr:unnamed protein product [Zymoseptoria tritici ST99CH_3D7]
MTVPRPPSRPRFPQLFARADQIASEVPIDNVYFSHALTMLQTFGLPLAFYFKPVIVFVAMSWLFYRAYQVMSTPLQELAALLGFDIPPAPLIDLASVKADGAMIHWSLPEKQKHKTSLKYEIHLNGAVIIDTLPVHESAATITGLRPGCFYVVRVSLVNNIEFSSKSEPIRFRTKPADSGDFYVAAPDGQDTDHDTAHEPVPRVRPYRGLKDIAPAAPDAVPMSREVSSGQRRSLNASRHSSAMQVDRRESSAEETEAPEGAETIQQLTERLDAIRKETDEAEKQAREEEEEEVNQKEELIKERDELRTEAAEKEKASRNLKREVNTLERQNTAAQNERSKHERILQQKKQDRQKLKDDIIRWQRETEEMKADVERIRQEKVSHLEEAEQEKEKLRIRQADEAALVKALDDEVREKSTEIKKMERAMKNGSPNSAEPETNLVQQLQQDAEAQRMWDGQVLLMQQQYGMTVQKLEQAKRFCAEQQNYLQTLQAKRRQEEATQYTSPPTTQDRQIRRGDSQRSRRAQSGHSSSDSPRLTNFPLSSGAFGPSLTSTAFPGAAFLNIHNGMTISQPTDGMTMSDEDRDRLTGGALMSPGAGADLLPADLFGEGDNDRFITPLPGLGSLPGMSNQVMQDPYPTSPQSGRSSRAQSILASPLSSQLNLHMGSPEHLIDADRRSVRSTRSNRAASGSGMVSTGSRFSGMFGIKQRAKNVSDADDGLALGKAQSHSMPRQDGGIPGLESASRKRNSSISGTLASGSYPSEGPIEGPSQPRSGAGASLRSRAFGIFSKEKSGGDGWPSTFTGLGRRPASPRPGSTHSSELPRPSFDSSRWGVDTWPSADAASGGARSSPLAFGATNWNIPVGQQSRIFGSRHPSRRPSQQYGNSGPPADIMEDEDSDMHDSRDRARHLGPIGSKPPPGSKKAGKAPAVLPSTSSTSAIAADEDDSTASPDAKLNPNAKDFKSFFSSMRLRSKDSAPSTIASSSSHQHLENHTDVAEHDVSPTTSRKSRDTRDTYSVTTASSIAESGRNSYDLARTVSGSMSDIATPGAEGGRGTGSAQPSPMLGSSTSKESFMQKLTRKSSAGGKFTLPTFKRERSRLDTSVRDLPGSPGLSTPGEEAGFDDSAGLGSSSGNLKESGGGEGKRGSVRGWGNVLKFGGGSSKKGASAVSVTTSEEGVTGDEEREERE